MNTPVNYYRYTITDRIGPLIVSPLGESEFQVAWERQTDGRLDYKNTLPNTIEFTGKAFHKLLKIETSIYRCDYCSILIERRCGNNWSPWFSGRFSGNEATWDLDACTVTVKLDDVDPDQCIEDAKDVQVNIFGVIGRRTVNVNPPNITVETVDFDKGSTAGEAVCSALSPWGDHGTPIDGLPSDGAWALYYESKTVTGSGGTQSCRIQSSYAREKISLPCGTPPDSPEWKVIIDGCPSGSSTWARPARLYGCEYTQPDFGVGTTVTVYQCSIVGQTPENIVIDNGMALDKVLQLFLKNACGSGYTVISDFFQINPDVVSTINYVTGLRSKTMFVTIYQKSDVKRPTVSGNATLANMTFDELLTSLVNLYNVRWRLDGNILRIEHVSFWTKNHGLDLTRKKYLPFVAGKRQYTYDSFAIPQKETFTAMENGPGDFRGVPILYTNCVTKPGRDSIKNYSIGRVTTDVQFVLANPDPDSDVVSDDGFVYIAADFDTATSVYFIISESGIFGGDSINNSLAWAQLQRDYWKWDRPTQYGQMNYINTAFNSVQPVKRGAAITIPLCCDDIFNPDDLVTTPLGQGTVDKASFSLKNQTITLQLLYVADENLVNNNAPVAVNDVVRTPLNTSVVVDVLANDTDDHNNIVSVEVYLPPLHGNAETSGRKIVYTPNTGYTGSDVFIYRITDDWGSVSNVAMVSVMVTAANTAPVANPDSYTTNKNTALTVAAPGVFSNDTDDVSFSLSSYDATSAHGGTVHVNTNGSFTYTPPSGYVGFDTFTYTIIDGSSLTGTGTVTIDVRDPAGPIANPDFYQTSKNTNLVVPVGTGVLHNDTTPGGTLTTTATTITTTQGGTVTMHADGSFTYVPPSGFTGTDTFPYTASNGTTTDSTTVTIQVLPEVFVRMSTPNLTNTPNTLHGCAGGRTDGGSTKSCTLRLNFYSNSAGTIPLDVTGMGIIVNYNIQIQHHAGGSFADNFQQVLGAGSQQDLFTGRNYFLQTINCDGQTLIYQYEVYSLMAGTYTII